MLTLSKVVFVNMVVNMSGCAATRQGDDNSDHDGDEQLKKGDLSCAMKRNINRKPKSKVHCHHDQHDHADRPM